MPPMRLALSEPSDVESVIFQRVKELFYEGNTRRLRIRLLGVRLEKLCVGASQGQHLRKMLRPARPA